MRGREIDFWNPPLPADEPLPAFAQAIDSWRPGGGMFFLGVVPALLTVYLRVRIPEPEISKRNQAAPNKMRLINLLFRTGARNSWSAALMMICIILGIWSSTFWVPTLIITKLTELGEPLVEAQRMASLSGILANVGTLIGCFAMPYIAVAIGSRRLTAALFFIGSFITTCSASTPKRSWANMGWPPTKSRG